MAGHATAGVAFYYEVLVENMGGDLPSAKLREGGADPRPDLLTFRQAREPGERQRNLFDKVFAFYRWQWLVECGKLFDAQECEVFSLKKGESQRVAMTLEPRKRGVVELVDLRLLLPEPLGLFQRVRRTEGVASKLCVLPKRYAVPEFHLPGAARDQVGDDVTSRQFGQGGEFASLREYRSGDSPRMMHWASWAKTGRPIVKELEEMIFPRYALVLDTFGEAGSEDRFEEAVSVAASFASALDTDECMLDLLFLGDRDHVVSAGRGVAPGVVLLEALASVKMGYEEKFDGLLRMTATHGKGITGCICVFHGWSESRDAFMRRLNAAGVPSRGFAIVQGGVNGEISYQVREDVDFLQSGKVGESLRKLR